MDTLPVYVQAIVQIRWLLDAVEAWLETVADTTPITMSHLCTIDKKRLATLDEVAVAVAALSALGIFHLGQPLRLSKQALLETSGYRRGVRDALDVSNFQQPTVQLCAAFPVGLASQIEGALREDLLDLRAALFDLMASARTRIVIASPFWDNTTADEMSVLFQKRLVSGVLIDVLGRVDKSSGNEYLALVKRFSSSSNIRFYSWYEPNSDDPFGTQTFHFKAGIADDGKKAYLGSANMTISGLRSRMELGVVLQERAAVTLAQVLDIVLSLSTRL